MHSENEVKNAKVVCPYCSTCIEIVVDCSAGSQRYVEDCSVCCRPMEVSLQVHGDGAMKVTVERED
jgi:hypothetical protein